MPWSPSGRQYLRLPSPESARYEAGSPGNFVRRSPSLDIPSSHPMVSVTNDRSVTPSQAAQNLGHEESHHPSSEGKGKAVAHNLVLSDAAETVEQSMIPSTLSTFLAPKRPPRLLDLQTSIQAHLEGDRARIHPPLQIKGRALSSRSLSEAGTVPSLKIKGREKPSLSFQSSPPSLLSRISGTHLGEKSNPATAALSSPRLSNDHSRHPHPRDEDGGQLTSYEPRTLPFSPEHLSPMNALSGLHDTQDTQSRARDNRSMTKKIKKSVAVAKKLDANEGSSTSAFLTKVYRSASNDSEGPIDNPHVDSGLAYGGRMNGEVLGSDPRPSSVQIQGSHTTVSTLNMRLLHKLEEEKRHLQDNNLSATLFNSEDLTDVFVGRNTAVVTDPHAMEAKLRARAQLKMRLASEKGNLAPPKQS
ncbi:hypothetical protein GGU10DRAFT_86362 [Lentinula aff. detonsa]|uniref:Uncharacterized protein n=1 Tax=Lentinula aff. detonsa TaxID=2804958 RepID=A0AA38NHX3_9AGAR|nr:hypothetical protein GGU10DRAFT_86362 [Lentinula aff. detonsa]